MACTNNLKQIGLAVHNYAATYNDRLPRGSVDGSASAVEGRLGVLVLLLPYLECNPLYTKIDQKQGWDSAANRGLLDDRLPGRAYRCPADHREGVSNHATYVAVAGSGEGAPLLPLKDRRAGAFGFDRTVLLKDVKDGTSNTVFFIETQHDTGPWASAAATVRGVDPDDETPVGKGRDFGVHHAASEWNWGRMPGEANAALGDGSVRTLGAKTSAELLAALATVAGGEDMAALEW